jgi:hypothetical protein
VIYDGSSVEFFCESEASAFFNGAAHFRHFILNQIPLDFWGFAQQMHSLFKLTGVATIVPSAEEPEPIRDHSDNFQVAISASSLPTAAAATEQESPAHAADGVQTWQFDRCFMLTGHGPDARLVEQVRTMRLRLSGKE